MNISLQDIGESLKKRLFAPSSFNLSQTNPRGGLVQQVVGGVNRILESPTPNPYDAPNVTYKQAFKNFVATAPQEYAKFQYQGAKSLGLPDWLAQPFARTNQLVAGGTTNLGIGTYKTVTAKNPIEYVQGVGQGIKGFGQIAAAGLPVTQVANFAASGPKVPGDITRRAGIGYLQGISGMEFAQSNVPNQDMTVRAFGQQFNFDPVKTVAGMVGFVQNPVNKKILETTAGFKLPFANKTINFLGTNTLRGGTEGVLFTINDMPDDISNKQKVEFMAKNFAFGAGANLIFAGGEAGVKKSIQTIGKYKTPELVAVYDDLKSGLNKVKNMSAEDLPIGLQVKPIGGQKAVAEAEALAQSKKAIAKTIIPTASDEYLTSLKRGEPAQLGIRQRVSDWLASIKQKMVDATSPIEDTLTNAEKRYNYRVRPGEDVRLQIDRSYRSSQLAGQFAKDKGLVDIIKEVPGGDDMHAFNQYLIAKQAKAVEAQGFKTGRDLAKDAQLVKDLAPIYEPFAKRINQYTRDLLDYSVQAGLVSKETATMLKAKYPDYVPINRVFDAIELNQYRGTGRGPASLSRQTVVQSLKGSERDIVNPIESILAKTNDAFNQGERNIAAKQLASYRDLPGFEGLIEELPRTARVNPNTTFSYIDGGVKRTFQTSPEIATAAKNLDAQQMGFLAKVLSVPTRVLQLTATGLNIPFAATNALKDQITAFINSDRAAYTSLLNPKNFAKSFFSAVKHDDLYEEVVRNAAGGTSFDIARAAPKLSVANIRSQASAGKRIKYLVLNPKTGAGELLRTIENFVGRGEELGRIQNYAGMKQALLKDKRTLVDAELLAAKAARENTANFARKGEYGKMLNYVIPFFNAGIQGSRQLVRSFQKNPVGTSTKFAIAIGMPVAASTIYNLADPERKAIYNDIPEYEKESNLIIIGEGRTNKGKYNVTKIPLPPGLSNLATLIRRPIEASQGLDPVKFNEIWTNLFTAGTSVDVTSGTRLASTVTPQAIKPFVETAINKNLYTGRDIVPSYMKNLPVNLQSYGDESLQTRLAAKLFNVSPLIAENFASTAFAGVGKQVSGQESIFGNLQRRFTYSASGEQYNRANKVIDEYSALHAKRQKLIDAGDNEGAVQLTRDNFDVFSKESVIKQYRTEFNKLSKTKKDIMDSKLTEEQKRVSLNTVADRQRMLASMLNSLIK